jgi:hypothetical protein
VPDAVRWRHWVVTLDSIGRIRLPTAARLDGDGSWALLAASHGWPLVLRRAGLGAPRHVDDRCRLTLPGWLRRLVGPGGAVLVSAAVPDAAAVVVAPATVLDVLAGQVAEEVG